MKRKGFTLIEFLIGMAMTVLIFIVATNLVVSFLTVNNKSKRSQEVEQVKTDITYALTDELTWGTDVSFSSNSLKIDNNTYTITDGVLSRNNIAITPKNVKVTKMELKKFDSTGTNTQAISYALDITLEHAESSSITDTLEIFTSSRTGVTSTVTTETPTPKPN